MVDIVGLLIMFYKYSKISEVIAGTTKSKTTIAFTDISSLAF